MFNALYATSAQNTGFWNPPPGNPGGPANLFDGSIYERGGMTLEALREKVGGATFFRILRDWVAQHRYGNASTRQFIELASADSGRDLATSCAPGCFGRSNVANLRFPELCRQRGETRSSLGGRVHRA